MTASTIVQALLEADEEADPKEFAGRFKPQKFYRNIVFLQDDADAEEALRLIVYDCPMAALEWLKNWDYGEGDVTTEPPWGDADDTDFLVTGENQKYVISWNRGLGYVGLSEVINDFTEKGDHELPDSSSPGE